MRVESPFSLQQPKSRKTEFTLCAMALVEVELKALFLFLFNSCDMLKNTYIRAKPFQHYS